MLLLSLLLLMLLMLLILLILFLLLLLLLLLLLSLFKSLTVVSCSLTGKEFPQCLWPFSLAGGLFSRGSQQGAAQGCVPVHPCGIPTPASISPCLPCPQCPRASTEPCSNTGSVSSPASALTGALDKSPSQGRDKDNNSDLYHTWILNNRVPNTSLFCIKH